MRFMRFLGKFHRKWKPENVVIKSKTRPWSKIRKKTCWCSVVKCVRQVITSSNLAKTTEDSNSSWITFWGFLRSGKNCKRSGLVTHFLVRVFSILNRENSLCVRFSLPSVSRESRFAIKQFCESQVTVNSRNSFLYCRSKLSPVIKFSV